MAITHNIHMNGKNLSSLGALIDLFKLGLMGIVELFAVLFLDVVMW